MFQSLIKILLNRNMILVLAVLSGILLGEHADRMKDSLFILAFVMIAATPPGVAVIPFSQILGGKYALQHPGNL